MRATHAAALTPAIFNPDFDINAWTDIPYHVHGNCWEFIRAILASAEVSLPSFSGNVLCLREAGAQLTAWRLVPTHTAGPGDVLIFDMPSGYPPHAGLAIGHGDFIHCAVNHRSTIDSYFRKFWRERLQEVYHRT